MKFKLKIFLSIFIFLGLISSCSSDGPASEDDDIIQKVNGSLNGRLVVGDSFMEVNGLMEITKDGDFSLDVSSGTLNGTATLSENSYSITIDGSQGLFEGASNISGTYYNDTNSLVLEGTSNKGIGFAIAGDVLTLEESNQQWRDNLEKSAVLFTHNEDCSATITVNDVTLETINGHWHPGGYCDSYYTEEGFFGNRDEEYSRALCTEGILESMNGGQVEYSGCHAAIFVLDKNTQYSYSVEWGNGETDTGDFTTADGGMAIFECLSFEGDCSNENGESETPNISENTLTTDGDYKEGAEEQFNFNDHEFSVRNGEAIWIGKYAYGSDSFLRFVDPNGLTEKIYDLEEEDDLILEVTFGGDRNYPFELASYIPPPAEKNGTVEIIQLDYQNKQITIQFNNVIVAQSMSWGPSKYVRFSGKIVASFEEVKL